MQRFKIGRPDWIWLGFYVLITQHLAISKMDSQVDLREHDIWWHGVAWGQTPGSLRIFLPGKPFPSHAGIAILLQPQHSTLLTRRLRHSATLPRTSCTAVYAGFVTWPEHRCKPNTGWKL